jgi:spermidine/putrescine transport system ATP-binding protein
MVGDKKVRFLNHVWECVDDFPMNEKVDVVVRPEDFKLTVIKNIEDAPEGALIGKVTNKIFKGIHFEYLVMVGKSEVIVQSTYDREIGSLVSIKVSPENIQIMEKELTKNVYLDSWINKNNQVVISDEPFDCDVTQLLAGSKLDEEGYLVGKDGKRYDLNDADVIAEVGLGDIEISDVEDSGNVSGKIVDIVYKGDHYQVMVRTDVEEDFVIDTLYSWNIDDVVWVSIPKNKIKLTLKGDIKKYVIEE